MSKFSGAGLGGAYNALLRSPEMGRRCFELVDYLRFGTSLEPRLKEFAILIQARIANAQYEWWLHEPIGRRDGLSESVIFELKACQRPTGMQEDERMVYEYCIQLGLNQRVPQELRGELVTKFGEEAVLDLTALSGASVMMAMLVNATQPAIPNEDAEPLHVLNAVDIRARLLG